jgi:hypothetical protein
MNQILYENRCRCNEEFSITKKRKSITRSEGKPLQYPNEITSKIFQIKYEKRLSPLAKVILNSFQNKYIYYAIDDILYSFKANPAERENLLAILYSPILSLQNNFSINFFDIWIREVYIEEISKTNKFINADQDPENGSVIHDPSLASEPIMDRHSQISGQFSYITIKLLYKTRIPVKKQESLW